MVDSNYTYRLLYIPFEVARVRMPVGLPAGMVPCGSKIVHCTL